MRKFKIGEVAQIDLERFLNTYIKYIESNSGLRNEKSKIVDESMYK